MKVLTKASIAAAFIGAFGVIFLYSGIYNVAATQPHWPTVYRLMEITRVQSVKFHARGIQSPLNMDDEQRAIRGTTHFAAHCAICHGAPGVPKGDIAHGMYPSPPDLSHVADHYSSSELFWILENGLKMTGMPSWKDHEEEELWDTVAFMIKLRTMTEADYGRLIQAGMSMESHQHDTKSLDSENGTHNEH